MKPPGKKYVLTPGLRLDYAPFDDRHQDLIERLNALAGGAADENAAERLARTEAFVKAFVDHMHFEVSILRALGYEGTDEHEAHHATIEKAAAAFLDDCRAGGVADDAVQNFAWCFLEDAIKEDLKAKSFLEGKPVDVS
jgi:hemerythrin